MSGVFDELSDAQTEKARAYGRFSPATQRGGMMEREAAALGNTDANVERESVDTTDPYPTRAQSPRIPSQSAETTTVASNVYSTQWSALLHEAASVDSYLAEMLRESTKRRSSRSRSYSPMRGTDESNERSGNSRHNTLSSLALTPPTKAGLSAPTNKRLMGRYDAVETQDSTAPSASPSSSSYPGRVSPSIFKRRRKLDSLIQSLDPEWKVDSGDGNRRRGGGDDVHSLTTNNSKNEMEASARASWSPLKDPRTTLRRTSAEKRVRFATTNESTNERTNAGTNPGYYARRLVDGDVRATNAFSREREAEEPLPHFTSHYSLTLKR